MKLVLCLANSSGDKKNCLYPNRVEVSSAEEMAKAVSFDHVCAEYDKNYRSISNFRKSNVVVMDCDNDHSDNPADWMTSEALDDLMPDIAYAVAPSRHNMLEKDGRSARPRFHVYFLIEETTDADYYTALKNAIYQAYPFFDGNARDAARFIFGADVDEVIWHDGWVLISEEVTLSEEQQELPTTKGPILEGNRNNTLSRFAGRVLKRYGETDKAHEIFLEEAEKCNPPLDDSELQTIWFSAIKFFRNKVSSDSGYVPPDQFNDDFGGGAGSLKPEDYSDVGQAKVLSREYGDELKYTAATDYIRYDGEVWVEDKQMAVGACVEFLDLQLQDAKDSIEEAKKALVDAGYDEATVNQGSKALAKDIQPEHLGLFYMLVGAEKYLAFTMKRRDYKYIEYYPA